MYTSFPSLINDDFFADLDSLFSSSRFSFNEVFPPSNVIVEADGSALLEFALAGYKKEELSIEVEDGKLTIEGIPAETEEKGKAYRMKIRKCSFKRIYTLPGNLYNFDAATVSYENGLLSIRIPRREKQVTSAKKLTIE